MEIEFKPLKIMIVNQEIWQRFAFSYKLSPEQLGQFQRYYALLREWNSRINLTAITTEAEVIAYHFEDSLQLTNFYDFSGCSMMADIGTGAGFPGIPLKIMFPHLSVVLVEVVQKKVIFLQEVIKELNLTNISVYSSDWRTFLRQTEFPLQLICARASLRPDELIRMFQASSPYKNAQLVYWASIDWTAQDREYNYLKREERYQVGNRERKYIFLNVLR